MAKTLRFFCALTIQLAAFSSTAQSTSQTITLRPGWNAVFLESNQNRRTATQQYVECQTQRRLLFKLFRKALAGVEAVSGHQAVAETDDFVRLGPGHRRCQQNGQYRQ